MEEIEKKIKELLSKDRGSEGISSGALGMVNGVLKVLEGLVRPFSMVQNSAIELAKTVGLSSQSIMKSSKRLIELNSKAGLSVSYGISNEEIIDLQKTLMTSIGRNIRIDEAGINRPDLNDENYDSALENSIAAYGLIGAQLGEFVAGYDRIGKTAKAAAKDTGKLFYEASKYGLNFQEYSKTFISNLGMAQRMNFRNGVDGLREMARRATEIKQDMSQVAQFAEKVGTVTGAVETAAQLQVLGGSFATLANPLAMLNESLVNPENLQKRLINMTESMAVYDPMTHQVRMNAVNRQKLRRAAEAMGVNPDNLLTQAFSQGRRREIERQMTGFGGMDESVKTLLKNIGEIDEETGVAGATVNGKFRSIGEIASSPRLQEELIEETRSESEDVKLIAKSVMGIEKQITGRRSALKNEAARSVVKPGVFGKSTIDVAQREVENINPELIYGAGKLDSISRMFDPTSIAYHGAFIEPLKAVAAFNGENAEKFGEELSNSLKNALGDNELTKFLAPELKSAGTWAANLAASFNEFTKKYGAYFFAPLKDNTLTTVEQGRDVTTTTQNVLTEASNRATNNTTLPPVQSRGNLSNAANAISTASVGNNGGVFDSVLKNLEGTYLEPVIMPLKTLHDENKVRIIENNGSIPSIIVSQPIASSTGNNQTQGAGAGENHVITINLNGEFKFVGDKGEITAKDIEELMENHTQFKEAITNMVKKASEELAKRGPRS